jgi:hypothetical protein
MHPAPSSSTPIAANKRFAIVPSERNVAPVRGNDQALPAWP